MQLSESIAASEAWLHPENPNPSNPEGFGTPHGSRELSSELVVWYYPPGRHVNAKNNKKGFATRQKPTTVQNETIKDVNGNVIAKATGVEGKIVDTITVDGKPAPDIKVTEANQDTDTKNGQPVSSTLAEGKGSTNANGQISDIIGIYHPTDGTKATNNQIKADFGTNTWTSTDKQTLTLTLPSGCTCSATSTRTLTNAGPDGPSSKYTLTTTQPVVTPVPNNP